MAAAIVVSLARHGRAKRWMREASLIAAFKKCARLILPWLIYLRAYLLLRDMVGLLLRSFGAEL